MAETQTYPVPERMAGAHCDSKEKYDKLYEESIEDPAAFWGKIAADFKWEKPWSNVCKSSLQRFLVSD